MKVLQEHAILFQFSSQLFKSPQSKHSKIASSLLLLLLKNSSRISQSKSTQSQKKKRNTTRRKIKMKKKSTSAPAKKNQRNALQMLEQDHSQQFASVQTLIPQRSHQRKSQRSTEIFHSSASSSRLAKISTTTSTTASSA